MTRGRRDFDIPGDPFVGRTERGDWMMTFTGRKFFIADPCVEDVCIEDIAHHLAMECRYAGGVSSFFSVAEHSVLVSRYVPPEYALEALLHDGGEAYCKDIQRPLKRHPALRGYEALLDRVQATVFAAFGIVPTPASTAAVKRIDDSIVLDETRALMRYPDEYPSRHPGAVVLGAPIEAWRPELAEVNFLLRFYELGGGAS